MNLYLRLIWALLRAWRAPVIQAGDTIERHFTVLPNDIDVNGHMNNGRYLTILDLMLIEYFVRFGFFKVCVRNGWRPMAGGSFITYRRGLSPFQRYTVRFRTEGSNVHWNFMRFEFWAAGQLCAAGYVKGAVVGRKGLVTNAESCAQLGVAQDTRMPEPVAHWLAGEAALMNSLR
jgi:acyl-CoA thioesterase FadM